MSTIENHQPLTEAERSQGTTNQGTYGHVASVTKVLAAFGQVPS